MTVCDVIPTNWELIENLHLFGTPTSESTFLRLMTTNLPKLNPIQLYFSHFMRPNILSSITNGSFSFLSFCLDIDKLNGCNWGRRYEGTIRLYVVSRREAEAAWAQMLIEEFSTWEGEMEWLGGSEAGTVKAIEMRKRKVLKGAFRQIFETHGPHGEALSQYWAMKPAQFGVPDLDVSYIAEDEIGEDKGDVGLECPMDDLSLHPALDDAVEHMMLE